MKRHEPCTHLRPDYRRMEISHYITRDPDTGEVSWEPTEMDEELIRLGLIIAPNAKQPRAIRWTDDPDT